jgi:hypothetical protein
LLYIPHLETWLAVHAGKFANKSTAKLRGDVVFMSKANILAEGTHEWNCWDTGRWRGLGHFDTVHLD